MKSVIAALALCLAPTSAFAAAAPTEAVAPAPDAVALIDQANEKLEAQDAAGARRLMEQAAATGDAEALNGLGGYVLLGVGGEPDQAEARRLFEQAVAKGSKGALLNLGDLLVRSSSDPADQKRGVGLLRQAVEVDSLERPAAGSLGVALMFGWGVDQDLKRGADLLEIADGGLDASGQGGSNDEGVLYMLGRTYEQGWGGRARDPARAYRYFRRAAERGHPRAAWYAAMALLNGDGVRKDEAEAYRWARKAAEGGDRRGQISTAVMLAIGQGVEEGDPQARVWYERVAAQGSAHGLRGLGAMLFTGEGGPAEHVRGYAYLELAAEAGDENAGVILKDLRVKLTPEQRRAVDAQKKAWLDAHGKPTSDQD